MTDELLLEIASDELTALRSFPRGHKRVPALAECAMILGLCATEAQARDLARQYARGARAAGATGDRSRPGQWGGADSFRRFCEAALSRPKPEELAGFGGEDFYGFPVHWHEIQTGRGLQEFERRVEIEVEKRIAELTPDALNNLREETTRYIEHRLRVSPQVRDNPHRPQQTFAAAMIQVFLYRHANTITPGRYLTPWNKNSR